MPRMTINDLQGLVDDLRKLTGYDLFVDRSVGSTRLAVHLQGGGSHEVTPLMTSGELGSFIAGAVRGAEMAKGKQLVKYPKRWRKIRSSRPSR